MAAFILAHWGGLPFFFECKPGLRQTFKNVYFDTSASSLLFDKTVFRRVVDLAGAERMLSGTDIPCFATRANRARRTSPGRSPTRARPG